MSLSAADRAVALSEADELWRALNQPLSTDSPLYSELVNNPAARQTLAALERNMLKAPSMESITGVEFEQPHPNAAPRPRTAPRLGRIMGGVGALSVVFDLYLGIRAAIDPSYAEAYLCQIFPGSIHCYPGGVPAA